jgi:hypothetical protein
MANTFQSIASGFATLKNFYEGPIVSQFNDEVKLYRGMEKGKQKYNGQQVIRPLKVVRNQGIGATTDGGPLPDIGKQGTAQAIIAAKYNYLRFGLTGPMLKASQGDKGSFISELTFEMEQGLVDFKNDINRQLFWNGRGDLAVVAANALASNVITVTGRTASEAGNKYITDPGIVIDIVDPVTSVFKATGVTVTAVSGTSTATLTLNQVVTCSASDIVVRTNAYNNEIQGLLSTLDGLTSTVYNIDRSVYTAYQGNSINAQGGQLTLNILEQTLNEIRRRGGAKLSAIYSDFDSERFYNKLLVADKRYLDKKSGDGTFSNKDETYLEYAGVPWVSDKDSPSYVWMLTEGHLKKYVLSELEWADETGAYLIAQPSADVWEARLRFFANVFDEKPSANARLHNYISP